MNKIEAFRRNNNQPKIKGTIEFTEVTLDEAAGSVIVKATYTFGDITREVSLNYTNISVDTDQALELIISHVADKAVKDYLGVKEEGERKVRVVQGHNSIKDRLLGQYAFEQVDPPKVVEPVPLEEPLL